MNRLCPIFILLLFVFSCTKSKEDAPNSMCGEYSLASIIFYGLPVDLDNDGTGRNDIMEELDGALGFSAGQSKVRIIQEADETMKCEGSFPIIEYITKDDTIIKATVRQAFFGNIPVYPQAGLPSRIQIIQPDDGMLSELEVSVRLNTKNEFYVTLRGKAVLYDNLNKRFSKDYLEYRFQK
ncbi:MAG: hypothetical protein IJ222_04220 [Bacteroidales bacterium]|nr:hypothetical protein [Bacteroidales bacterium]